ncbi:unnamed protein product [Clavelina lepadiformis]|uniref:Uncharacterized protein n=1 Tax=Clavelina lepadiformis TaxID=159417 RepID=A0ABP0G8H3_CLALP
MAASGVLTEATSVGQNVTEPPFDATRFFVLETANCVFTLVTFYLSVAFVIYECSRRGRNRSPPSMRSNPASSAQRSRKYALAMKIESISACVCLFGRFICQHYEFVAQYTGNYTYDYCDVVLKAKFYLTAIAVLGIYGFLWTRQNFCYADPAMKHLTSCAVKTCSWLSFGLILCAQVVGTLLFTFTRFYAMTYQGCDVDHYTVEPFVPWLWIAGCTVGFQVILLCLFVYPLMKHRSSVNSGVRGNSGAFLRLIKRATVTTVVCVVTDITSTLLILLVHDQFNIVPTLVFDLSIVINITCILAAFKGWQGRLFAPCYYVTKNAKMKDAETGFAASSLRMSGRQNPNRELPQQESTLWSISGIVTSPRTPRKVAFVNPTPIKETDSEEKTSTLPRTLS